MMTEISIEVAVDKIAQMSGKTPGFVRDKLHLHGEGSMSEKEFLEYAEDFFFLMHSDESVGHSDEFNDRAIQANATMFARRALHEAIKESERIEQQQRIIEAKKNEMIAHLKAAEAKKAMKAKAKEREEEESREEKLRLAAARVQHSAQDGAADNYSPSQYKKAA